MRADSIIAAGIYAALAAIPAPAEACMAANFETWVFVSTPPRDVPRGLSVFEVVVPVKVQDFKQVEVDLVPRSYYREPGYLEPKLRISAGRWSSCSRWGVTGRRAFVVGILTYDALGQEFLAAVQQPRDELLWRANP